MPLGARDRYHTSSSVSISLALPARLAVLHSLRLYDVFSWCTHSKLSHRLSWLRICFGALQTLEIRRLFSHLQCEPSVSGLQRDAAGWYRPGYSTFGFVQDPGPLKRPLVILLPKGDVGTHGSRGFNVRSESPRDRLSIFVVSFRMGVFLSDPTSHVDLSRDGPGEPW